MNQQFWARWFWANQRFWTDQQFGTVLDGRPKGDDDGGVFSYVLQHLRRCSAGSGVNGVTAGMLFLSAYGRQEQPEHNNAVSE